MTRSMADRTNKAAGIKVISQVGRDPEANRYGLLIRKRNEPYQAPIQ